MAAQQPSIVDLERTQKRILDDWGAMTRRYAQGLITPQHFQVLNQFYADQYADISDIIADRIASMEPPVPVNTEERRPNFV